jgi:hypothetical protein
LFLFNLCNFPLVTWEIVGDVITGLVTTSSTLGFLLLFGVTTTVSSSATSVVSASSLCFLFFFFFFSDVSALVLSIHKSYRFFTVDYS